MNVEVRPNSLLQYLRPHEPIFSKTDQRKLKARYRELGVSTKTAGAKVKEVVSDYNAHKVAHHDERRIIRRQHAALANQEKWVQTAEFSKSLETLGELIGAGVTVKQINQELQAKHDLIKQTGRRLLRRDRSDII